VPHGLVQGLAVSRGSAWNAPWRTNPVRPPPCTLCGLVEPADEHQPAGHRHSCNPTSVQMMEIGVAGVERVGRAIVDAMRALGTHEPRREKIPPAPGMKTE
jgi:hypothetical protein